jgi:transcriptional regulator with XRE-family HTH domain
VSHGHVRLDGAKLRRVRRERGLTMDRLAAASGGIISARELLEYETGRRRCDPARFVVLRAALAVTPASLAVTEPDEAELADLRHWAGLTAEGAARHFGFSRWSLLRAEAIGRLPQGTHRRAFISTACSAYVQPYQIIDAALVRAELRNR